jgi:outer membrane protein TolC
VDQAQASFDAALAAYRQAVLNALREVEDNLVALNLLGVEADQQAQAVAAAEEAQRRSLNQYKAGTVNFTSVVTTQAAANSAQRAASQLVGRRYLASVELIKALGGGWQGLTNTGPAAGAGR